MRLRPASLILASGLAVASPAAAIAQDSVAASPGASDALSAWDLDRQRVRYAVDLAPITSSWGGSFGVAPILKASRGVDPMFPTQGLGSIALSAGHRAGVTIPAANYALWSTPGAGANSEANTAPTQQVSRTGFDRAFGVAFSDFGVEPGDQTRPTNIVGAIVGQDTANLSRLWVERTTAIVSRNAPLEGDSCTLSLGAIDEGGNVYLRADEFNASLGFASVKGENQLRVALPKRETTPGSVGSINFIINFSGNPQGPNTTLSENGVKFLVNNSQVTANTPVGLFHPIVPGVLDESAMQLGLDFKGDLRIGRDASGAASAGNAHRASGVAGLRGNPTISPLVHPTPASTAGAGAVLAIPAGSEGASAINLFGIAAPASPTALATIAPGSARLAALPSPITGPGGFMANASGAAEFTHWLSQVSFRGPSGQVGLGRAIVGGQERTVVAATATDPGAPTAPAREFIAVATDTGAGAFAWTVAARIGSPVLDGPGGQHIGELRAASPASISTPAVDLLGNIYFVAAWRDSRSGSPVNRTGLFRAVRSGASAAGQYSLELLLSTGDEFQGQNSATPCTITRLALTDSDSVASSGFHGGQILQAQIPGRETTATSSPFASGGMIVAAGIEYERAGGVREPYEAVLFVGPRSSLPGDANGDGVVNFPDLNLVLQNFGVSGQNVPGDVTGDGVVNFSDLNLVLQNFGSTAF